LRFPDLTTVRPYQWFVHELTKQVLSDRPEDKSDCRCQHHLANYLPDRESVEALGQSMDDPAA
jgi:hypothetical protein